jgi:V8-like Glu-specific endopeptidase
MKFLIFVILIISQTATALIKKSDSGISKTEVDSWGDVFKSQAEPLSTSHNELLNQIPPVLAKSAPFATVFGNDNRVEIEESVWPWTTIGELEIKNVEHDNGYEYFKCTATLVGECVALTAAHCIVRNPDDSIKPITFRPSFDSEKYQVTEAIMDERVNYFTFLDESKVKEETLALDWAIIRLNGNPGSAEKWGSSGLIKVSKAEEFFRESTIRMVQENSENKKQKISNKPIGAIYKQSFNKVINVKTAGYSGDVFGGNISYDPLCGNAFYRNIYSNKQILPQKLIFHKADMNKGASGSSLFVGEGVNMNIVGIVVAGASTNYLDETAREYNYAVPTEVFYDYLQHELSEPCGP